jgi:putative intracellular protease/amidase
MPGQPKILVPLPDRDFDVTEVAVPWKHFVSRRWDVVFATENGDKPACDPLLLTGVLFGKLGADPEPKRFYEELETSDPRFRAPLRWADVDPGDYDALVLPGGHAPGMRQYLGSDVLQSKVAAFWALERPVGAICHGVLVLARAIDPRTGKSVLARAHTTCLPKYMERSAYLISFWKLGTYYRTYPAYVEDEVKGALDDPATQFVRGPRTLSRRGTADDDAAAFVVDDGRYVSARWPGDAYRFAKEVAARVDAARPR